MDLSHNYIKSLVEKYYKDYEHIIPLDYQKNYIYNAVYTYFTQMDTYMKGQIAKNYFIDDLTELHKQYSSQNSFVSQSRGESDMFVHSFVINLDVGLGKTITSIITARVMKEIFEELFKSEKELFLRKITKDIGTKTGFNKSLLEGLLVSINDKLSALTSEVFKVGVVARRNLCLEFNEFLKDDVDFLYFPYGRTIGTLREKSQNKELGELLLVFIQYNYQIDLRYNAFPYDLFIVDEFGNDPVFFGNGEGNTFVREYVNSIVIGLTANTSIRSMCVRGSCIKGPRKLKSDDDVRKELIAKKLYSGNNEFTYKFVDVRGDSLKTELDKFRSIKEQSIWMMNTNLVDLSNFKQELKSTLDLLFSGKDLQKGKIDEIIMTINKYKNSSKLGELFGKQDSLINNVQGKLILFKRKLIRVCMIHLRMYSHILILDIFLNQIRLLFLIKLILLRI